jgi:hypothetical protein
MVTGMVNDLKERLESVEASLVETRKAIDVHMKSRKNGGSSSEGEGEGEDGSGG